MNCQECLDHVAEYAENELAGKSISASLEAIKVHLDLCVECRDEYRALITAIKAMDSLPTRGDSRSV